jgi:hypothetical protein
MASTRFGTHRVLVAVLVGVGLVIALSFPFALAYDAKIDRQRAGYNDAATVVRMQTALISSGEEPVAFESGPGEPVQIGDETFRAGPGNHVVSQVTPDGICVQVQNDDPGVRAWTYDSADGEHPYDDISGGACPG